jgi:hypothetical protein
MVNFKRVLSIGLASAALAVVLTYVLGAPVLLQTAQAEQGHELFMSMWAPLIQAITGKSIGSQMHGGAPASDDSTMQGMSESQMQGGMNKGLIGNNMLGSPKTLPSAGFAAVVVMSVIPLATAAFVVSRKQESYLIAGLLAASGVMLMILPLANLNFVIPGPIIGVIVGLAILGLGVAKGIRTARTVTAIPR